MNTKAIFKFIAPFLLGLALIGSKEQPPGEYDASEVGKIKRVVPGVVISKRAVNLHRPSTEAHATQTKENNEGNFVDSGYNQTRGVEYVIKLNSGSIISVVQSEDLK